MSAYVDPSSFDESQLVQGKVKPMRVRSTPCDRILYLCDSNQRISGNAFDFTVRSYRPMNPQSVYISRCQLPKIPNINPLNNVVTFYTNADSLVPKSFTIPPAYYNQVSLVNALKLGFDTAAGGLDTYTVAFASNNKTVSITSISGIKFYISNDCTFSLRGINVCHFDGYPAGSDPNVVGSLAVYSSIIGLCYSRYVVIRSNRLTESCVEVPRSSSGKINICAMVSIAEHFNASDYDASGSFTGSIITDQTIESSAVLNLASHFKPLDAIDIVVEDEYGFSLADSFNLGSPYSSNSLSCLIWLTVSL